MPSISKVTTTEIGATTASTRRVATLPDYHKDPLDRALIAQAQVQIIRILSADRTIACYRVELNW